MVAGPDFCAIMLPSLSTVATAALEVEAVYMDATIQSLQFSNPNKGLDTPEYPENVVRVDLTLENRGNTYHHTRYLSCYDIKKIAFQTT